MPKPTDLVLDSNVVLDLFWFQDHRCGALAVALAGGHYRWLASVDMRSEIEHVMARGLRGTWPGDATAVRAAWDRWATTVEPDGRPSPPGLRCTDGDDQKFIDLALQVGAAGLLSRDRAVLRLARRAAQQGLVIATPERWAAVGMPAH